MIGEGEHPEGTSLLGEDRALLLLKARQRGGQLERADHEPEPVEVVLVQPPHQLPDRGADTVRADDQVEPLRRRLLGLGVCQHDRHPVAVLGDGGRCGGEADAHVVRQGLEGSLLDVAPEHHPRPVGQVLEAETRFAVASPVHRACLCPGWGPVGDSLQAHPGCGDPAAPEHRDEVPAATPAGRTFDDHRVPARLLQGSRGGQPGDAGPDDQCFA